MRQYFFLQLKRCVRYLPCLLCVALILGAGLWALQRTDPGSEQAKVNIAVVGTAEDSLMESVLAALSGLDSTRFSVELVTMEETDARAALAGGTIEAYLKFPEGFLDAIRYGQVKPVEYVSLGGAPELSRMVTEELTEVVTRLLTDAQKGIYGAGAALQDNGQSHAAGQMIYDISIEYVLLVLNRDATYRVQTLQLGGGLGLEGTLLCGLTVTLCFLLTLPFAPLFVKRDYALERMLAAKGRGAAAQLLCQLGAYFCVMSAAFLLIVPAAAAVLALPEGLRGVSGFLSLLPILVLTVSMSLCLYEMTRDLISGVVLNFIAGLGLCFVGGCLYPVWFFPDAVQLAAPWLPAGMAQCWLTGVAEGKPSGVYALGLVGYSLLFILLAVALRRWKTGKGAAL